MNGSSDRVRARQARFRLCAVSSRWAHTTDKAPALAAKRPIAGNEAERAFRLPRFV